MHSVHAECTTETPGPNFSVDKSLVNICVDADQERGRADPLLATFAGAGRRRGRDAAMMAQAERDADQAVAEALAREGLMPWREADPVTAVDLATEGARACAPRRELRPWAVFIGVTRRAAAEAAAEMMSWLAEQDTDELARRETVCLTLRRRGCWPVLIGELAARHRALTEALGPALGYAATRNGAACVPLSYGVHHRLIGEGSITALVDVHVHATFYVERGVAGKAALMWLVEYLGKGWEVHVGEARPADSGSACASAAYEEDGLSWDDMVLASNAGWLAEYVRQVHLDNHLHRRMTLGPLRRHVGALRRAGVRPVICREQPAEAPTLDTTVNPKNPSLPPSPRIRGLVQYRPIRCRPARRPHPVPAPVGPRVLAARLSWLPCRHDGGAGSGEQVRPVILVRGWDVSDPALSWQRLVAAYDLEPLVCAARDVLSGCLGRATGEGSPDTGMTGPPDP